jgi:transposase
VIGKPVEVGPPSIACGDFLACNKVIVLDKSVDPFAYVVSANVHRRHLNYEQRVEALAKIIACSPEKSDRQIAKELGVDHKTIGRARAKGEDVGSIPHVATRTDARGRKQPVKKRQTERSKQRAEADRQRTGVTGKSELARLRARNEEIERENRRLEGENLALRSQVEELRAELAKRAPSAAPPADDGLDIPAFLQRSGP